MTDHFGHRDNPIVPVVPGELDRACARVWDPTPDQAQAGNYKMAHAILGSWDIKLGDTGPGIHVTIETPMNRMRHGAGMDGKPWSVRMPAHYGYVKRTEAADGDHVDVYIGPESHRVAALPVWIVDQRDKDTLAYDEAKVMLGFPDSRAARTAYVSAFSDGKGHERIGGVARTTFEGFRRWLASDRAKKPVVMRKSAWDAATPASYVPATCSCTGRCGCVRPSGGSMTEATTAAKTDVSATGLGRLMLLVSKGLASLSPKERTEFLADSAASAGIELGKAEEMMNTVGEGHDKIPLFEDLWDGPPDDKLKTTSAHGPNSSAPSGEVNVGPNQAASGNGAEKMEREYSRHAPRQSGVQRATEMLGEAIMGIKSMKSAMGSMIIAVKSQGLQIETLKAGTATVDIPDAKAIQGMIDSAVGKAISSMERTIAKSIRNAVAKADDEKDDDKDDEKDTESGTDDEAEDDETDDEADEEESGSGTEIEIVNENEAEDEDESDADDEKAKAKSAAKYRLMAKCRIKWASRRLVKADELDEASKPKKASRYRRMGKSNLRKARAYLDAAKALRDGRAGPSTVAIGKAIAKARGKAPKPHNQETWPNKNEHSAKATPTATQVVPDGGAATKAIQDAVAQLQKAASGLGMLTTTVSGLYEAMGSQSRGQGNGMPPALHLAMAKGGDVATKDAALAALADAGTITMDDLDNARDVMRLGGTTVAPEFINSKIGRLPLVVRNVLTAQAA